MLRAAAGSPSHEAAVSGQCQQHVTVRDSPSLSAKPVVIQFADANFESLHREMLPL